MNKYIYLLIFIFSFFLPNISISQCYTILSVKGEIILEKTGLPIKELDEVCSNDKLIFSTLDSKAAVLSPDQGRFIIKLSNNKKANKLKAFLNEVLFQGSARLSTKGTENLESEFGDNYFVIGSGRIIIDLSDYPMDDKSYFYLNYVFDGEKINKKLKFDKDTLFMDNNVYKNGEIIIDQKKIDYVNLYYYEKEKNISTKITSFKLIFADEEKLKHELSNYISILKNSGKDNDIIYEEVILYLYDIYGNVNTENAKSWLGINFKIL